jgi:hypothetical protein
MKAELERELAALSLEEKNEAYTFLMPFVKPSEGGDEISPELLAELERRIQEDDQSPEAAMSLENFKLRWVHRK